MEGVCALDCGNRERAILQHCPTMLRILLQRFVEGVLPYLLHLPVHDWGISSRRNVVVAGQASEETTYGFGVDISTQGYSRYEHQSSCGSVGSLKCELTTAQVR